MNTTLRDIEGLLALFGDPDTVVAIGSIGFGAGTETKPGNVYKALEKGLAHEIEYDAVYVFSDFNYQAAEVDTSDLRGWRRFGKRVQGERLRLYVGTVMCPPPGGLVDLAKQFGGGLVGPDLRGADSICVPHPSGAWGVPRG